jgi:hypothetical protein
MTFQDGLVHEHAGFFTALRMTCRVVFVIVQKQFPFFVILNELLGEEESL